jgi:hypothetical protein
MNNQHVEKRAYFFKLINQIMVDLVIFDGGWKNNSQIFAYDSRFGRGVVGWESFFQKMADFGSRPSNVFFIFLIYF